MKIGIKSVLGTAVGAAMLSACGPTQFVSPSNAGATASSTSPLKLGSGDVINPAAPIADLLYVKTSSVFGYYHGCLGKVSGTQWEMVLGQGNANCSNPNDLTCVRVAQLDQSCELRAIGLKRTIWNKIDAGKTGSTIVDERYDFHSIQTNSLGAMHVNDLTLSPIVNGLVAATNTADILVRDGYSLNNLRMAVRTDGVAMALVNISGTNTGAYPAGAGGYANDFEIMVLTGSSATELFNNQTSSQINYAVNLQASSKELPAPTYVMDTSTVRVAVDPLGFVTPASTGNFKMTVSTKQFIAQSGSEYILPLPADGETCTTSLSQIQGCGTAGSIVDPTQLPSESNYYNLSEAAQYAALFGRWQLLKDLGRPQRQITTSDRSIIVPILTFFPPGTHMFMFKAD
jgi:hypothetical protein